MNNKMNESRRVSVNSRHAKDYTDTDIDIPQSQPYLNNEKTLARDQVKVVKKGMGRGFVCCLLFGIILVNIACLSATIGSAWITIGHQGTMATKTDKLVKDVVILKKSFAVQHRTNTEIKDKLDIVINQVNRIQEEIKRIGEDLRKFNDGKVTDIDSIMESQ